MPWCSRCCGTTSPRSSRAWCSGSIRSARTICRISSCCHRTGCRSCFSPCTNGRSCCAARWLFLLSISLVMLFLTSGYYFMFAGVLVLLWLLWFLPRNLSLTHYASLAIAFGLSLAAVAPVLLHYRQAHAEQGLSRSIGEIEFYSADLSGLFSAPRMLWLWNTPESWQRPESALMPGATAVLLVALALWVRRRSTHPAMSRWTEWLRATALLGGLGMVAAASIPTLYGPIAYELGPMRLSVTDPYKPLSTATLLLGAWFLTTTRVRQAWRERSILGFYTVATVAMWLFALGPTARVFGHRVPLQGAVFVAHDASRIRWRVPRARSLRDARNNDIGGGGSRRLLPLDARSLTTIHGWEPQSRSLSRSPPKAGSTRCPCLVLRAAWRFRQRFPPTPRFSSCRRRSQKTRGRCYRSMEHRRHTVNGMSGHDAPYYTVLRLSLEEGHFEALKGFGRFGPIAVFVERNDRGARMLPLAKQLGGAIPVGTTSEYDVLLVPRTETTNPRSHDSKPAVPVQSASANAAPDLASRMIDGDLILRGCRPNVRMARRRSSSIWVDKPKSLALCWRRPEQSSLGESRSNSRPIERTG